MTIVSNERRNATGTKHGASLLLPVLALLWISAAGAGMLRLWNYKTRPGAVSRPPVNWPVGSIVPRATVGDTLILLAHPQCPCTRATLGELARLMARCQGRLTAWVLFYKPTAFPAGWEKTDLWRSAAAIPGVHVLRDEDGVEARRFHATTSGQTLLYNTDGQLLFSGGLTAARGHAGDNAGRDALESLLRHSAPETTRTPVFGCSLLGATIQENR